MFNPVLDFSKIESGGPELENAPYNLADAVEEVLDRLAPRASEKHLELACSIRPDTPLELTGDVGRLRQILVHIVGNAIKYTEKGEVLLSVSARPSVPGACQLFLEVKDTGIGIAPDRLHRLFQDFSQVDPSTPRPYGGAGLRLAISRRLAELMGGFIEVESTPGSGSCFRIAISAAVREAEFRQKLANLSKARVLALAQSDAFHFSIESALAGRVAELQVEHFLSSFLAALPRPHEAVILDTGTDSVHWQILSEVLQKSVALLGPTVVCHPVGWKREAVFRNCEPPRTIFAPKPVKSSVLCQLLRQCIKGDAAASSEPGKSAFDPLMAARHPLRFLLAEDHPVNQKVAQLMLAKFGYEVTAVANGREAVEAARSGNYDVILMDIQMPVMDGLQATVEIRKLNIPQPRIVAITANATRDDRSRCLQAGMDEFLSKPIRPSDLRALLQALGEQRQARPASFSPEIFDSLQERTGGDPEVLRELFAVYFAEARKSLRALADALRNADRDGLRRAAHHLKGSSQMMRADPIACLCRQLESGLNPESSRATLEQLETALREAEDSAAGFLRGLESTVSTSASLE
jgi:CheY-like chemotaxis protein/HPt (histidine-containing phosphotransfer) domain-containing protein